MEELEEKILKIIRNEIPETLRDTGKIRAAKEITSLFDLLEQINKSLEAKLQTFENRNMKQAKLIKVQYKIIKELNKNSWLVNDKLVWDLKEEIEQLKKELK